MLLKTNGLYNSEIVQKLENIWADLTEKSKPGFVRILSDDTNWQLSKKWGEVLKTKYKKLVLIGIGGSSMGARALANYKYSDQILFLDNIDPSEINSVWNQIRDNLSQTGFLIISKSGESLEIASLIEVFSKLTSEVNFNFFKNCFIISENKKSILTDLCKTQDIPLIEMPQDVGGRFSVLTTVGLVIAEFIGYDLQALRAGGKSVLDKKTELIQLATELAISIQNQTDLFVFWSYSSQLRWFNQWLSQLWGESLGKNKTSNNSPAPKIPWLAAATGCSDQHSIYQHILESTQKKYVLMTQSLETFPELSFTKPNLSFFKNKGFKISEVLTAERDATAQALKQYHVPVSEMLFTKYDDETLGFLFVWFEILTAALGHYLEINPYDQPAVALGKKIALENLRLN